MAVPCFTACTSLRTVNPEEADCESIADSMTATDGSVTDELTENEDEPRCIHDEHELQFDVEQLKWEDREVEKAARSKVGHHHAWERTNILRLPKQQLSSSVTVKLGARIGAQVTVQPIQR